MEIAGRLKTKLTFFFFLIVGIFIGGFLLRIGGMVSLKLLAGLFLAVLILYRPVIGILAIVGSISFIPFYAESPFPGIGSIHVPDIILYLLFFILFLKCLLSYEFRIITTPIDPPIIAFFLVGFFSLIVGKILYSYDFFLAFKEFKVITYYLLAILVTNFVQNKSELKILVYGCILLGIAAALDLIFQAGINPPTAEDLPMEVFYKYQAANSGQLQCWVFVCLSCLLLVRGVRASYVLGAVTCWLPLFLGFSRHIWISMAFSVFFALSMAFKRYKTNLFAFLLVIFFFAFIVASAYLLRIGVVPNYMTLLASRIESLTSLENVGTLDVRLIENRYAFKKILANPLFGIGFTRPYRPQIYGPQDTITWFIHNGYLWILLKMGILGFIPFLWFSYIFIKRGLRNWSRIQDKFLSSIVLGSVVLYLGTALGNLAAAHFMQNWQVAIFGLSFGITEAIYKIERLD